MQDISLLESNSQSLTVDNYLSLNFNNDYFKPTLTAFPFLTKTKSYAPITGKVLEYILNNNDFSYLEKLYYILADALSVINAGYKQQRAVALSAKKWAARLNCSKSQVFTVQRSLEEKGYFIIVQSKNKFGHNNKNLIIPTLPNQVFYSLANSTDKEAGLPDYDNKKECKRSFLDRTKLFIRLNYLVLQTITSSEALLPFSKVIWLDLFTKCYKSHLSAKKQTDEFSVTLSYQELLKTHNCDKSQLSKALKNLEKNEFLTRKHLLNKVDKEAASRQDKSLWQITLSLPRQSMEELKTSLDRAKPSLLFNPFAVESSSIQISKEQYASTFCKYSTFLKGPDYKSESIDNQGGNSNSQIKMYSCIHRYKISYKISYPVVVYVPAVVKFSPLLTKDFKLKNIDFLDDDINENLQTNSTKSEFKQSEFYKNSFQESEAVESNGVNLTFNNPLTKTLAFGNSEFDTSLEIEVTEDNESKPEILNAPSQLTAQSLPITLKSWYPLSSLEVEELNKRAGREFSMNFVNELLLKLNSKYPDRVFSFKNQLMSYISKVLRYEKHQEPAVNHESFRFAIIDPIQQQKDKIEKYLAAIEANLNTAPASQLRRKIEALFNPEIAYRLLTESKYTRPQTDIFFVELPYELNLTETQQERLTNEILLIYGKNIEVMYGEMQESTSGNNANKIEGQKIERQQGEIYLEELDPDTAWYSVRVALKNQFGEGLDKAWFSKLTAEEDLAQRKIILKAPTNFIRDLVAQKYSSNIENICRELGFNFDYRNDLIVETDRFLMQKLNDSDLIVPGEMQNSNSKYDLKSL